MLLRNKACGLLLLALPALAGCISDHSWGCDNTLVVASGLPEGEIYTAHGCPDQIIEFGNPTGPGHKHWRKYLVVYRIAAGSKLLGFISQGDAFSNIAYLVTDDGEKATIADGGYVTTGTGETILMSLESTRHFRRRVGYGGDPGWAGSYGQVGRTSNAWSGDGAQGGY